MNETNELPALDKANQALEIYRDVFSWAIKWVDHDKLREGLYLKVERADKLSPPINK